jgi:hypothetical protein
VHELKADALQLQCTQQQSEVDFLKKVLWEHKTVAHSYFGEAGMYQTLTSGNGQVQSHA